MNILHVLFEANNFSYCLVFPVVALVWCLKSYRVMALDFLEAMNMMMAFSALMSLLLVFYHIMIVDEEETYLWRNQMFGLFYWAFWINILLSQILPQLFWWKRFRRKLIYPFLILIGLNIEKIVVRLTLFHRDYLPSSWAIYPKQEESIGLILCLLLYIGVVYGISKWIKLRRKDSHSS